MKIQELAKKFMVKPGKKVNLEKHDPDYTAGFKNKEKTLKVLAQNHEKLARLQYLLYAENKHALMII